MVSTTYACDRCGEVATERRSIYRYALPYVTAAYDMRVIDLCPECMREMDAWLGAGKEEPTWQQRTTASR